MKNSTTDAQELNSIIKDINHAPTPETCRNIGSPGMLSHDDVAAKYAYESALMLGKIDMSTLIRQLEHLRDNGAAFNIERAFHKAITLRNQ